VNNLLQQGIRGENGNDDFGLSSDSGSAHTEQTGKHIYSNTGKIGGPVKFSRAKNSFVSLDFLGSSCAIVETCHACARIDST
jgi:hypothetical protein